MTYPGDGQSGWGGQSGQGDWGRPDHGYAQQGYPQQGYGGSYGGLGVFSGGDEPPKRNKTKLWLVIGAVVLVLVGGGVTAFVLTRPDRTSPVAQTTGSSPTTTSSSTSSAKPTTSVDPDATCQAAKPGWNCLPVPTLSYSYDVPKGWSPVPGSAPVAGMPDVKLTGITVTGAYDCGGKDFTRGGAGGVVVPQTDLPAVAKDFARNLGTQYYNSAPDFDVKVGEPKAVKVAGDIEAVQVDATITTSGNECLATKGMVKVLVMKGGKGSHVFMSNGDLEGGPAEPGPQAEADLQAMVDSVKPLSR